MPTSRPIVLIENDLEDQDIIAVNYAQLGLPYPLKTFDTGETALEYLKKENIFPFIVISDINMPGMNGFELRDKILREEELKNKCIPYIFLTSSSSRETVIEAYSLSVQGIFTKPFTNGELKELLSSIVDYWKKASSPSSSLSSSRK